VVILGPTGRNIAAGMSGGIAYVLDLNPARVNPDMVEVEQLTEQDRQWLHTTVSRHFAETESAVAAALLADWPRRVDSIAKIMPRDYKRVLEATELAEQEGRDVEAAIMEASRG
jgi:glutamate synthase (NADPH/NADH) large chain